MSQETQEQVQEQTAPVFEEVANNINDWLTDNSL
mgnify:CR=1 FL=1